MTLHQNPGPTYNPVGHSHSRIQNLYGYTKCPGQNLPKRNFNNLRTNADMKIKFTAKERWTFQVLCMMLATFSHCC